MIALNRGKIRNQQTTATAAFGKIEPVKLLAHLAKSFIEHSSMLLRPAVVPFDSINFSVPTNKISSGMLERSQWSELKLHSGEMVLTCNFSKQQ